jgi:hypothetical protein
MILYIGLVLMLALAYIGTIVWEGEKNKQISTRDACFAYIFLIISASALLTQMIRIALLHSLIPH